MRKFRLLPVIAVSTVLMMGITGCESTTQQPAKEETKKEETKEEETKQPGSIVPRNCISDGFSTML